MKVKLINETEPLNELPTVYKDNTKYVHVIIKKLLGIFTKLCLLLLQLFKIKQSNVTLENKIEFQMTNDVQEAKW